MLKNVRPNVLIIGLLIVIAVAVFACRGGSSLIPQTGSNAPYQSNQPSGSQPQDLLGPMFVASRVDQNGCPVDRLTQTSGQNPVYVGVSQSSIPRGTSIFARLLQNGQGLEDTQPITAQQDMTNTCVWFQFRPSSTSNGFQAGNYTAQIIVNGNVASQASFVVNGAQTAPFGQQGENALQLDRLTTTSQVDQNGCPTDNAAQFSSNDTVYVAFSRSYIPTGTQMFARLLYNGSPVEDTQPIRASQTMNTCIWFQFQATQNSQGLQPGQYEAQVFVNGQMADQVQFEVR